MIRVGHCWFVLTCGVQHRAQTHGALSQRDEPICPARSGQYISGVYRGGDRSSAHRRPALFARPFCGGRRRVGVTPGQLRLRGDRAADWRRPPGAANQRQPPDEGPDSDCSPASAGNGTGSGHREGTWVQS